MLTWQEFGNYGITLTQTGCLIGTIVLGVIIKFGEWYNKVEHEKEEE